VVLYVLNEVLKGILLQLYCCWFLSIFRSYSTTFKIYHITFFFWNNYHITFL